MSKKISLSTFLQSVLWFFKKVYLVYMACALLFAVCAAPFITFVSKRLFVGLNPVLFVFASAFGMCLCAVFTYARSKSWRFVGNKSRVFTILSPAICLLLFALQLFIVKHAWFYSGWDVAAITNFEQPSSSYFSTFPNQLFLAGLFRSIATFGQLIGIQTGYISVTIGSCVCVTSSIWLCAQVAKRMAGYVVGYATLLFSCIFIGLSPWILVPYSDTYGMLFVSLLLFLYVYMRAGYVKNFMIVFLTLVGIFIKPTVIFVTMAIIAIELVNRIRQKQAVLSIQQFIKKPLRCIGTIAVITAAVGCGVGVRAALIPSTLTIDKNEAIPMAHYLMMGFNPADMGIFSAEDYRYIFQFSTPQEKSAHALQRWHERVQAMGVAGAAKQFFNKTLIDYTDGSFGWKVEGSPIKQIMGDSTALNTWYGISYTTTTIAPFEVLHQLLWFVVLIGIALKCFVRNQCNQNDIETVMLIALLALNVFLLLFECRSRYLFLYMPFFVALGMMGWSQVAQWTQQEH